MFTKPVDLTGAAAFVALNRGDGTFLPARELPSGGRPLLFDFDNDGALDLFLDPNRGPCNQLVGSLIDEEHRLRGRHPDGLTAEEQAFVNGPVEELCGMLDEWDITHNRKDLPPEVWKFIRDKGFLGIIIPKSFGGLGFSAYAHSQVITKLSTRSGTVAVTVLVPTPNPLVRVGGDSMPKPRCAMKSL